MKKVAIIISSFILLVYGTAFMNDQDLGIITQKLQHYFNEFPAEKLYLHFSEDVWVAGEKVWCKAYLVKENNLQFATDSKVMYAELRNRQGEIVQSLTMYTSNGMAKGNFILSDSLSNGWYQIHAYTQWMLNYDEESHFIRPVFVVNPLQEKPQILSPKNITANDLKLTMLSPADHLMAEVPNRLRWGITHSTGEGVQLKGAIVAENDSLISPIQTNTFGIGSAQLTPETGKRYFFRMVLDGDTARYSLPSVIHQQVAIEIDLQATDALQVKVHRLDENYHANNLYLVAVSDESIVYAEPLKLRSDQVLIELPYSLFKQGMGHIALFNEETEVLDAQAVAIPYTSGLLVNITTDQASYASREKGLISVSLSDNQGNPVAAHASVTVRKTSALSDAMPDIHINNFLLSGSERMGLTQPTPVFDWTDIIHQPAQAVHFPKEKEGITIKGKLLYPDGQPIAQQRVVLSVAGTETWFQYDYTQEDGSFHLLIERVFGEKNVVIQAPEMEESYQIVLDEAKDQMQLPALQLLPNLDEYDLEDFIQQCRQRVKIDDMYAFYQQGTADNMQQKKRQQAPFRFYGVPNVELYLEDYIALPNMEEVCRELLPGVQLKIDGNDYDFNVFDVRTRTFLPDEPSLFVDGVLVFDKAQVVNFPPENIEKIETINRRTFYGDFPFNGVVSIFTIEGNQYESMLPQNALQTTLSFYDKPESFPAVNYQENDSRTPDLRTLLYWNPDVKFNEEGKVTLVYVHSDETGTFEIVVEGITMDGRPFSHEIQYEVVFQ